MPRLHPHAGVDGEHAAGNRRHSADHHSHQLALGHAFEIRLNDQWRLGLAHEHIGGSAEAFAAAGAHHALHHPGYSADNSLQYPKVVEQAGDHCD